MGYLQVNSKMNDDSSKFELVDQFMKDVPFIYSKNVRGDNILVDSIKRKKGEVLKSSRHVL